MTAYQHLYPFSPWGWHGGTQRLRTALEASCLHGTATLHWWDRTQLAWRSDIPIEQVGMPHPESVTASQQGRKVGLKRRMFPFALWEAGLKPRSAVGGLLAQMSDSTVVLHTTFLAPLAAGLRENGNRVVVDVHDVVFRGHLDDADAASGGVRAIRRTYAASVKRRECHALEASDVLAVAGWDDMRRLTDLGLSRARWAPSGLEARLSGVPETDRLCVGLLGNFDHSTTAAAARELVESPLGRDPTVQIVLAGIGSDRYAADQRVLTLGQVTRVDQFYDRVHATVVPVMNGTGMKCKLGEAVLAGKAVITTPLGAMGYPPDLRDAFIVVQGADSMNKGLVEAATQNGVSQRMRDKFDQIVGRRAATCTYADLLEAIPDPNDAV